MSASERRVDLVSLKTPMGRHVLADVGEEFRCTRPLAVFGYFLIRVYQR